MKQRELINLTRARDRLRLSSDKMLREKCEFLFPEDEAFFANDFLSEVIDVSNYRVDETLNEIQETALSTHGISYLVSATICSSLKNGVFHSFTVFRIISSLSSFSAHGSAEIFNWQECWEVFDANELLDVLYWLNWIIFENAEWTNEERVEYVRQLDPILKAVEGITHLINLKIDS
jgi:hypothetical protein